MIRNAIIESNHCYSLTREWDITNKNRTLFIMLNPCTADDQQDDMTTKRCINFAKRWECGNLEICNLFSYRTAYSKDLYALPHSEIIGEKNHYYLEKAFKEATIVVVAWGKLHNNPLRKQRSIQNLKLFYYLIF
ncbi:hypothetical protein COL41_04290 [Bacillus mycoides]|uniref:DUF1643 domain-containing protein n=1 Tax=Bacillus mycoides TaxID=1405 RepID=UPI000BF26157|nr:DUF1643 domain-containing protein [Bacillus mycoides]PFX98219.1 hypothetical protein COL41_04290 [Bacillus mycoides]